MAANTQIISNPTKIDKKASIIHKKQTIDNRFVLKIMIPAIFVFLLGIFFPLIIGVFISFTDSSAINGYFGKTTTIVNYYELFFYGGLNTRNFWQYTYQTLFFSVVAVSLEFLLGLSFALILNKEFKGRGLARATLLIPWALPTIASATIFRYEIFDTADNFGVFNSLLVAIGSREIAFFGADAQILFNLPVLIGYSPYYMNVPITTTMFTSIAIDVWKTTPFFSLLILAALQIVPNDLHNAASIAGASTWQKFRHITWPMIKPGVGIALVFRMMDAIRVYDAIVVFRDKSVRSMTYQAVDFWAKSQEYGLASAVAVIEFLLIIIFALLILRLTRRKEKSQKITKTKPNQEDKKPESTKSIEETKNNIDQELSQSLDSKSFPSIFDDNQELSDSISPVVLHRPNLMLIRIKRVSSKIIFSLLVIIMCLFCAGPFLWIVSRSFRDPYLAQNSFELFPKFLSIDAYRVVFENSEFYGVTFDRALLNGLILSTTTGLVVLIVGSFVGYALAKFKFPIKSVVTLIIFSMTSLPPLIIIIPYFIQVKAIADIFPFLDLTDNLLGLVLPYTAFNLPLAIFVLRSFFEEIPEDLWKAAKVDGASNFQIFWKVILPLTIPGIFTCFILVFIASWNELLFAQIWLTSDVNHTVPRAILRFVQSPLSLQANWDPDLALMAATSVATVPLVIVVLIFQKQIIKGITSGAVKG